MEKLLDTGKVKAIGVSNCSKAEIERIIQSAKVKPAVHQMECHPWLQQKAFAEWHQAQGIHVTQYSSLGNQNQMYSSKGVLGKLIDDPVLNEIGKKYGKSGAHVALGESTTSPISHQCIEERRTDKCRFLQRGVSTRATRCSASPRRPVASGPT